MNIAKMVTYRANITIIIKYEVAYGFRLAYSHMTLAHANDQRLRDVHFYCEY